MDEKTLEGGRFFMNHFTKEEWLHYVKNQLEEEVRTSYENHLYECDQCFELYLQAIDEARGELPLIEDGQKFTDEIMEKIDEDKLSKEKKIPFYQKTFFQYGIALAMTIFLMSSGVFQAIFQFVDEVQKPYEVESLTFTEGLMNKAFTFMDSIDISNRGGNRE